ncbi:hypothetical protein NA57DRAFT_58856 [Rhizodiscina lignyota]|uniref:Acyltransferase 3 domain-containing protein n=1 Tax=Rhizodiscina lignyota TaxID=1504668 RepID=A0A9P4IAC7_9PEZI|nr:hypothetical protein NA57DRAFT_58856 [Rhizodiscina lignyota]
MQRIQWVDGLRGIAAFLVTFNHFFNGEIEAPFRSFWAHPSDANRHLIQLPPIRILWAMDAMVPLFMVISGYSISRSLIHTRETRPDRLTAHFRSSFCRRPFRLFLPVLLLSITTQILFFFDIFHHIFRPRIYQLVQPGVAPCRHVGFLIEYMMDSLNLFDPQWNDGINEPLWTMPIEYRGSCIIYFIIIIQASWKPVPRIWSLACLMLYIWWYAYWAVLPFVGGLMLAEIQTAFPSCLTIRRGTGRCAQVVALTVGLYLLCLQSSDGYPPGYGFLVKAQTWHWTQYSTWLDTQRMWHGVGAILFFLGALDALWIHRLLCTGPVQTMGRLSYAVYLVHFAIYLLWRAPLRDALWRGITKSEYPGVETATAERLGLFLCVYVVAGLILGSVVVLTAQLYMEYVDGKVVRLSRAIDQWLNSRDLKEPNQIRDKSS